MPCFVPYSVSMPTKSSKPKVRVLSSKEMFRGPVFYVTSDQVVEPGGLKVRRDIVRHSGSVVILAVDEKRRLPRVLLERQYRHAAASFLWELPAGRIDEGEDTLTAARRELLEETGYTASRWQVALRFFASPGFVAEVMNLYLARDLHAGRARPEEDEIIHKRFFPLPAAMRMIMARKIRDAKTIAGVLWLRQFFSR